MADPVAGLREMARVTRPHGIVAACVWDHGTRRASLSPFWRVVRELDPTADDESQLAGARRGHLGQLFRAAGLGHVEETELTVERAFDGFDDWWEPFTQGVGPAGGYVAGLDEGGRTRLVDSLRATLPAGPFVLTAVAWTARGVRDGHSS